MLNIKIYNYTVLQAACLNKAFYCFLVIIIVLQLVYLYYFL